MNDLPPIDYHASLSLRRRTLLTQMQETPALIPAGSFIGRNYAGNPYAFRPSSHFIYLLGPHSFHLADSWLLLANGKTKLFTTAPCADDALWHGPSPSFDALSDLLQVQVCDLQTLSQELSGLKPATILAVDPNTQTQQTELLGRDVRTPSPIDQQLCSAMVQLRLKHDEAAQWEMRVAAEATAAAHRAGMKATRSDKFEWEIKAAMEYELSLRGMTTAYNPIVSTHGEVLHNNDYHHTLQNGDLILADVGAETRGGFAGDVTRTWPVSGTYQPEQRAIYEVVQRAQEEAIAMCTAGTRYRDIHLKACTALTEGLIDLGILKGSPEELVNDDVHALFFPHGVGHIIGLDVHDMEDLGDLAGYAAGRERSNRFGLCYLRLDRDLEPGMAVTIEPGFYQVPAILNDPDRVGPAKDCIQWGELEKYAQVRGIRIEDDILITEAGPENLTEAIPKSVSDVEQHIGASS